MAAINQRKKASVLSVLVLFVTPNSHLTVPASPPTAPKTVRLLLLLLYKGKVTEWSVYVLCPGLDHNEQLLSSNQYTTRFLSRAWMIC